MVIPNFLEIKIKISSFMLLAWTTMLFGVSQSNLEPETRQSKVEFEDMLFNQGWEQDINTPIRIPGDKVIANNFRGLQEGHAASRASADE